MGRRANRRPDPPSYSVKGLLFNSISDLISVVFISKIYQPVNCDYLHNTPNVGHIYCRKSSYERAEMNKQCRQRERVRARHRERVRERKRVREREGERGQERARERVRETEIERDRARERERE